MTEQMKKTTSTSKYILLLFLLALCAGVGYLVYQNPALLKIQKTDNVSQNIARLENDIKRLEQKIDAYQTQMPALLPQDIQKLSDKIDDMHKINVEILNSKASIASMMGLVERMDSLEQTVKKLGSFSSQSALILTSAALVDEAARRGEPFVYEAAVLENLSQNTPMEKSARIIATFASSGLPSDKNLIKKFEAIYQNKRLSEQQNNKDQPIKEDDWKETLANKLSTLVQIEKLTDDDEDIEDDHKVLALVKKGDFQTAVLKMETDDFFQTEEFEIWKEQVRAANIFAKEISKIKALTLGQMKAEILQKQNKQ